MPITRRTNGKAALEKRLDSQSVWGFFAMERAAFVVAALYAAARSRLPVSRMWQCWGDAVEPCGGHSSHRRTPDPLGAQAAE